MNRQVLIPMPWNVSVFWGTVLMALKISIYILLAVLLFTRAHAADLTIITDIHGNTGVLYDMGSVTLYGDAHGTTGQVIHEPMLDLWQFRTREGVISQGMVLPISPVEGFASQPSSRHSLALVPMLAFPTDPCPNCDDTERP